MKSIIAGIIFVVGSTTIVIGQQPRASTPAVEVETRAKLIAELAATAVRSVKNSPFSAEEVNESVQTLADGNRIVRSSTGKIYRNSEGRLRREHSGGTGGMYGSFYATAPRVSVLSPAEGQKYLFDTNEKTARVVELTQSHTELVIAQSEEERAKSVELLRREAPAAGRQPLAIAGSGAGGTGFATTVTSGSPGFSYTTTVGGRYETRTEDLGTRDFEGVSAEGTRRVTTIPAGAIGNELPIETVYERWFSKDLGMVVYSKNSDPRFGEQTYRLTNIMRTEPDPTLFNIPSNYKVSSEPGTVYRIGNTQPRQVKPAVRPAVSASSKP